MSIVQLLLMISLSNKKYVESEVMHFQLEDKKNAGNELNRQHVCRLR